MKRLVNQRNGVIAVVDEVTASNLGPEWVEGKPKAEPKPATKKAPARKRK